MVLIGTFKNGKPTGQISVTVDGEAQEVDSPFDEAEAADEAEPAEAAEEAKPAEEEEK